MTEPVERMLPLYEGRMGHQFNHRFATLGADSDITSERCALESSKFVVQPQYWVTEPDAARRHDRRRWGTRTTMLGHRRVARNNDERTCIATLLPWGAASYGWIMSTGPDAEALCYLAAAFNSPVYDYLLRGNLSQPSIPQSTSEQVPVPHRKMIDCGLTAIGAADPAMWLTRRVLELTYTAWDMQPFAEDLGDTGPPFVWDPERRFLLRSELDAAFFHLYGVSRDDADYILDTFPIVRRKDEEAHGEYRTKRVILEVFEVMQRAIDSGTTYESILTPAPGLGPRHATRSR